jgi:hypothetical protein
VEGFPEVQKSKLRRPAKTEIKKAGPRAKAAGPSRKRVLPVTLVAAAAVVLAGYFIFLPARPVKERRPGPEQALLWSADVQQIASNFNCPCGECGVTRLDQCDCDVPRGSMEARRYIRKLLDENLPKEEIIRKFDERYGNKA